MGNYDYIVGIQMLLIFYDLACKNYTFVCSSKPYI